MGKGWGEGGRLLGDRRKEVGEGGIMGSRAGVRLEKGWGEGGVGGKRRLELSRDIREWGRARQKWGRERWEQGYPAHH